ncbi:VIT family protein [bacterium]|nr:MAG: VIT family protein [bacterium]
MSYAKHIETHRTHTIGWLRAAVLGANDGIISTACLIVGVAASAATRQNILIAGVAGLVAGSMAMATGEYVSVSSQADTEKADLAKEKLELEADPVAEHHELAQIYVERGLELELAAQVATQLMKHDALGTHAREELGISEVLSANPLQAALASAATFTVGAALPLLTVLLAPRDRVGLVVSMTSLLFLAGLGAISAMVGGSKILTAASRVTFWGALAMGLSFLVGSLFGVQA